jgi:hypothetical protein
LTPGFQPLASAQALARRGLTPGPTGLLETHLAASIAVQSFTATMSQPEPPETPPSPSLQGLTREQKMALLQDELVKLNAQLEYLRLMLKLRPPRKPN